MFSGFIFNNLYLYVFLFFLIFSILIFFYLSGKATYTNIREIYDRRFPDKAEEREYKKYLEEREKNSKDIEEYVSQQIGHEKIHQNEKIIGIAPNIGPNTAEEMKRRMAEIKILDRKISETGEVDNTWEVKSQIKSDAKGYSRSKGR